MAQLIFIIIISTIITERLLEGLHRFYWTRKLKIYLVGEDKPHLVGEDINTGIVQIPWLREYIRCKFCQSWWMAWSAAALTIFTIGVVPHSGIALAIEIFLVGLIAGSLANKLHDLCDSIKAMKYLPPTFFYNSDDPAKHG